MSTTRKQKTTSAFRPDSSVIPAVEPRADNVEEDCSQFMKLITKPFTFRKGMDSKVVEELNVAELRAAIKAFPHYYEEFTGECVPYFDFDMKFSNEEELDQFINTGEKDLLTVAFTQVFGDDASFYFATSHGKGFNKDGSVFWKFSYHVIVRGVGKHGCGKEVQQVWVAKVDSPLSMADSKLKCDISVYKNKGSKQLMRTIYSMKKEDKSTKRLLIPVDSEGNKITRLTNAEFKNYLLQWTGDEEEIVVEEEKPEVKPKKPVKKEEKKEKKEEKVDTDEEIMNEIYDSIGDDGAFDMQGEKKTLAFDEVKLIVNGLSCSRFGNYDAWCKLLWAVARWQDETGEDEEKTIEMLDEYCQNCAGYSDSTDVEKKYAEAFKRNGRSSQVKIGTLCMWLREDNPSVLSNLFKAKRADAAEEAAGKYKAFDRRDPYCYVNFVKEHSNKVFKDREEMDASLLTNVPRVLAAVLLNRGFYVKKDDCDNSLFSLTDQIKGVNDFNLQYTVDKVDGRTKDKKVKKAIETVKFSKWLSDDTCLKKYANVGIYPDEKYEKCPDNHFNMWEGYQAEIVEVDEKKIEYIKFILLVIWANNNENLYKFILAWLRFIVAHPAEMTKVALFLYSEEGAGKGTIIDFIMKYILGYGLGFNFTGVDEVVEKHNTNLKGKKLICINEMGSTKDQFISNFDKIKPKITDPMIAENPKGKGIIKVNNISNCIMCTNHKNSIYITEGDRRYTCIEVSNVKCGNQHKKWWGEVNKEIMNQETGNHFYSWLLSLNEDELPNPKEVFKTELRDEIVELSRDNVLVFADWFLENEYADEDGDGIRAEEKAMVLYNEYRDWCVNNGERPKANKQFGMAMKTVLETKRKNTGIVYVIPPKPIEQTAE